MPKRCSHLRLTSNEEALLNLTENQVEALLASAKADDDAQRDMLLGWVYIQARNYYCFKAQKETSEGDELAGALVLHFEHRIDQIRTAVGWTRFMLAHTPHWMKHNKSRVDFVEHATLEKHDTRNAPPVNPEDVDDEKRAQYRIMMKIMENESEVTRSILKYRLENPPRTHEVIAELLNMKPANVRKRVQRFYDKVKKAWKK